MRTLLPCSGCQRHVLADERSCPFCDAPIDLSRLRDEPSTIGLSRAAALALGAALAACSTPQPGPSGPIPSVTTPDGKTKPPREDPGEMRTLYGMPPPPPSGTAPTPTTPGPGTATPPPKTSASASLTLPDPGGPSAAYGAPPPPKKR